MSRIAFLGAGNMASAMAEGLLARGAAAREDLVCHSASGVSAANLANRAGIERARSLESLLDGADALVVAIKPQQLTSLDPKIAALSEGTLVISVLAGATLARLGAVFPRARAIVRCMPNLPGRIGAGITAWCASANLADSDRKIVADLLGALGADVPVPEDQMDAVTGLSGSGPGFVFEFAAALREGGIAAGLPPATAEKLTAHMLSGAASLLFSKPGAAEALRGQVSSPKGTTLAGLERLEAGRFREAVREAVIAAARRASELSKG